VKIIKSYTELEVVVYTRNPSSQEGDAGRSSVQGQLGLQCFLGIEIQTGNFGIFFGDTWV
jgi:hypothetical protein